MSLAICPATRALLLEVKKERSYFISCQKELMVDVNVTLLLVLVPGQDINYSSFSLPLHESIICAVNASFLIKKPIDQLKVSE